MNTTAMNISPKNIGRGVKMTTTIILSLGEPLIEGTLRQVVEDHCPTCASEWFACRHDALLAVDGVMEDGGAMVRVVLN